ncbi:MAG TPA: hypothetical protein VGB45_14540 [Abditibacterium sp.]|jgi:hypothetical protein
MNSFNQRMFAAGAFIVVTFVGLVVYAARVAPRMGRDSNTAVEQFYSRCRARDYEGAHAFFGSNLRPAISKAQLQKEWTKFEARNGALAKWESAGSISINGFGGSVCVFPPFVDFRHAVKGKSGKGTLIYIRMVPENDGWKLERFNVLR